jgi:hypothetical protein
VAASIHAPPYGYYSIKPEGTACQGEAIIMAVWANQCRLPAQRNRRPRTRSRGTGSYGKSGRLAPFVADTGLHADRGHAPKLSPGEVCPMAVLTAWNPGPSTGGRTYRGC